MKREEVDRRVKEEEEAYTDKFSANSRSLIIHYLSFFIYCFPPPSFKTVRLSIGIPSFSIFFYLPFFLKMNQYEQYFFFSLAKPKILLSFFQRNKFWKVANEKFMK